MFCDRYKEDLMDLALGGPALGPRREKELRAHLEVCATCRAELDAQRQLAAAMDRAIGASVAEVPSAALAARIRQRVAAEPQPARWWNLPQVAWLPVAAGAMAVLAMAVFMAHQHRSAPHSPAVEVATVRTPPAPDSEAPPPVRTNGEARGGMPHVAGAGRKPDSAAKQPELAQASYPEVLIPADERLAVTQLIAVPRLRAEAARLNVTAKPLDIPELDIAPIEIPALSGETPPREGRLPPPAPDGR